MLKQFILRLPLVAAMIVALVGTAEAQWYNFNVIVYNTSTNTGIPGAVVTIDQDFGNGTSRSADGSGFTNFGVWETQIGYSVSAGGFNSSSGTAYVNDHTTIYVGLTPVAAGGRYVWTGSGASLACEFNPTQNGPNQCDPNVPPPGDAPAPPETVWQETQPEQLSLSLQSAASFAAAGVPTCRATVRNGNVGYISAQTTSAPTWNPSNSTWAPAGTLQWGISMHQQIYNFGQWWVRAYVNGVVRDEKWGLERQPHGTLPPSVAPAGSDIYIHAYHLYMKWYIAPVRLPDGRWVWRGFFAPVLAWGSLNCTMPYPGQ